MRSARHYRRLARQSIRRPTDNLRRDAAPGLIGAVDDRTHIVFCRWDLPREEAAGDHLAIGGGNQIGIQLDTPLRRPRGAVLRFEMAQIDEQNHIAMRGTPRTGAERDQAMRALEAFEQPRL